MLSFRRPHVSKVEFRDCMQSCRGGDLPEPGVAALTSSWSRSPHVGRMSRGLILFRVVTGLFCTCTLDLFLDFRPSIERLVIKRS